MSLIDAHWTIAKHRALGFALVLGTTWAYQEARNFLYPSSPEEEVADEMAPPDTSAQVDECVSRLAARLVDRGLEPSAAVDVEPDPARLV